MDNSLLVEAQDLVTRLIQLVAAADIDEASFCAICENANGSDSTAMVVVTTTDMTSKMLQAYLDKVKDQGFMRTVDQWPPMPDTD